MNIHLYTWLITIGVMAAVLLFDVFVIGRKPHEPSMKECGIFVGAFVGLAILFGIGVTYFSGPQYGKEFFAGWLTEYSLSLDNLFIFIIIMAKMKVPRQLQQYALLVGIILALVFRGIFIALGKSMIEAAAWVFFIFGAYLLYTAIDLVKDYFEKDHDDEATENLMIRWVKRTLPFTEDWQGTKSAVKINGKRFFTPMFLVIVALGSTDVLFALDSIPAIYGLTQEPYLVFTANVFALMGLRQLYFLIGGLLNKLVYLPIGLSIILGFIGVKLVLHAAHHYHLVGDWAEIGIEMSLGVIVVTLVVTTVASLMKTRNMSDEELAEMH
ncbi:MULTISPECIES: TerC family protein [Luteococcus]|uniref:Integral membrane protein TerC n=1 Tax=Luteococcus japonicus LSP_Lj1 TaxID=1255658 RepID=A0A1R4KM67_9ACTN|nr:MULTISPECIES: TerC family protein [Luteococcus]MDN5563429.1 TerC family protein [Luteococcus sp.]SJN45267.1 Integral membrane protein TerC [Luteococcus japonicus LSP_Lj1]